VPFGIHRLGLLDGDRDRLLHVADLNLVREPLRTPHLRRNLMRQSVLHCSERGEPYGGTEQRPDQQSVRTPLREAWKRGGAHGALERVPVFGADGSALAKRFDTFIGELRQNDFYKESFAVKFGLC
jgi:hypothetical protein